MAYGEPDEVAGVERVVYFAEEGYQREAVARAVCLSGAGAGARPHEVGVEDREVGLVAGEPCRSLADKLHACESVEVVLTEVDVIACHEVPHPASPVLLFCFYGVLVVCDVAFGDRVGEYALFFLRVVESERGANVEAFEGGEVDVSVAEQTPVVIAVVFVADEACERVFAVGVSSDRTCELAGCSVHGE